MTMSEQEFAELIDAACYSGGSEQVEKSKASLRAAYHAQAQALEEAREQLQLANVVQRNAKVERDRQDKTVAGLLATIHRVWRALGVTTHESWQQAGYQEISVLVGELHIERDTLTARVKWLEEGRALLTDEHLQYDGFSGYADWNLCYKAWLAQEPTEGGRES